MRGSYSQGVICSLKYAKLGFFSYLANSLSLYTFCSLVLSPVQLVLAAEQNYSHLKSPISIKQEMKDWIFVAQAILLHKWKSREAPMKSIFCLDSACM